MVLGGLWTLSNHSREMQDPQIQPSSFVLFPEFFVVAAVRVCCAANLILKNVPAGRGCLTFGSDVTENSSNTPNPYPPSAKLS